MKGSPRKNEPVYLSAPLALLGDEGDEQLPKHFSGTAYSGDRVPDRNIVIDLDTTEIAPDMPLLASHDRESIVGVTKDFKKNGSLQISGDLFSDIDDSAKAIARKSKRGVKYQMSVGIFGFTWEDVPAGKSITVNGRTFQGPIGVFRHGTIRETSILPLGADPKTNASFFSSGLSRPEQEQDTMSIEQLQERINQLQAETATLKTERDAAVKRAETAEQKLKETEDLHKADKLKARTEKVKAYFKAIGREFKDETAKPYLEMPEAAFAQLEADVGDIRSRMPEHLFREQATGELGKQGGGNSALLSDAKARATTTA